MTLVVLALVVAAVLLLVAAGRLGRRTGVRAGAAIVGSDVGRDSPILLEAPRIGLRGRPDYLLRERTRHRVYPVEVKPTRESTTLYESDLMQLVAYMLLTEARFGSEFAGYGLVRYRSAEFRVTLTGELRRRAIVAVVDVRAARRAAAVHRSHGIAARCRACALRGRCGEGL